ESFEIVDDTIVTGASETATPPAAAIAPASLDTVTRFPSTWSWVSVEWDPTISPAATPSAPECPTAWRRLFEMTEPVTTTLAPSSLAPPATDSPPMTSDRADPTLPDTVDPVTVICPVTP